VTISHPCTVESQDSLSCDCSLFSSPQSISQSQTIDPLSRQHLCVALWDKGSDRMSFFTKASPWHQSSYYLTKSLHWIYCLQEVWDYPAAKIASLSPGPSGLWMHFWLPLRLQRSWEWVWKCLLLFSVPQFPHAFPLSATVFMIPDALPLLLSSQ
jgi:hypothetical protein